MKIGKSQGIAPHDIRSLLDIDEASEFIMFITFNTSCGSF